LLGGGEGVRGGVVFAFFFCGLEDRGPCSFKGLLGLSLLSGIGLDLSPEARVFLPQCLHLISAALLQISQLLLHFGLTVKDDGQVRGDVSGSGRASVRLLVSSSSTTG